MITSIRTSQKLERYRGAATVEAAIVIVLLLMLILGTMGFGILFLRAQEITTAARQGARLACVNGADSTKVTTTINAYLSSQGITNATGSPAITYGADNTVTFTVQGKGLDILYLGNNSLMRTIRVVSG
jgi:Flp pilus assembly protein TadG